MISKYINQYRKQRDYSIEKMAFLIGIEPLTLSNILREKSLPSMETALKLRSYFGPSIFSRYINQSINEFSPITRFILDGLELLEAKKYNYLIDHLDLKIVDPSSIDDINFYKYEKYRAVFLANYLFFTYNSTNEAISLLKQAYEIDKNDSICRPYFQEHISDARILINSAAFCIYNNEYDRALYQLKQCNLESITNPRLKIVYLSNLAYTHYLLGNYSLSLELSERCLHEDGCIHYPDLHIKLLYRKGVTSTIKSGEIEFFTFDYARFFARLTKHTELWDSLEINLKNVHNITLPDSNTNY